MRIHSLFLLFALMAVSCSQRASYSNDVAVPDSLAECADTVAEILTDEVSGTGNAHFSLENIKKYEQRYLEEIVAEYTDRELEEMNAWVEDKIPFYVAETDRMLDAVDDYNLKNYGNRYYPCSWGEGYNPAAIPEVESWAKTVMNIDGVSFGTILYILQSNKKRDISADRYDSKENYYIDYYMRLSMSGAPDFATFLNGLIQLHRNECTMSQLKEADAWMSNN